jgi:capsular exopolysaccharide synthesis family protein
MLVQFEPGYPAARALASQVAELDRAIAREEARVHQSFAGSYREALAREQALQTRVKSLESGVLDLRRRSIQYNIFQRDVDTNRQLYDGLLQRYKEIGVAGGVGTNNISMVDEAKLPQRPSSPRLMLNLLVAFGIGLALAVALTLALEQIDEAVADPTDLKKATGLALLGVIPKVPDGDISASLADRKSATSEAFLSVQTNLQFSTDHGVPRCFAVTSTRPGEGKSSTCFALAQSLARTRRSVVLVDGDMRSPSVHHIAGTPNEAGTSNFLSGNDDLEAMIVSVGQLGFSVLPAGPQPPSAAELLTGPRLSLLIERLTAIYDHVIIDSPPVLGLADAPLIGGRVEGVLYVIQAQGPRSSVVRTSLGRLRAANVNILGGLLSKFEAQRAHYGYGYDYGYGYGQSEKG